MKRRVNLEERKNLTTIPRKTSAGQAYTKEELFLVSFVSVVSFVVERFSLQKQKN
jgi:hypothetical protein